MLLGRSKSFDPESELEIYFNILIQLKTEKKITFYIFTTPYSNQSATANIIKELFKAPICFEGNYKSFKTDYCLHPHYSKIYNKNNLFRLCVL